MSVAVATKPVPAKPVTLTGAELATASAALKARWTMADANETKTLDLFKAADVAWQNARIIKVRVAYAAGMLVPDKGKANQTNASRILFTNPEDAPAKRTSQAKSRKNTLTNYLAAGEALQEQGLATRTGEPDDVERKIVADVFRAMNKAAKDRDKAAKDGEESGEESGETAPEQDDTDALTFVDLVGLVARMNGMLDIMAAGSVVITEREASSMADMLAGFQAKLSAYATDK